LTTSEATSLPEGALEEVAARVGASVQGDHAGAGLRVAAACSLFNGGITHRLVVGALDGLFACGLDRGDVTVAWVPGAFELPLCARALVGTGSFDAVIALGAVIRGETGHYDFVAGECAAGLQRVQLDTGVPVVFGVLTTDTVDQVLARSAEDVENKGREAALTAVAMARLLRSPKLAAPASKAARSSS